jgi:uncharacterized protein
MRVRIAAAALALAAFVLAHAAEVPFLTGRIVDNAEILKPATRSALNDALAAHEQRTGDQIVVLTVPTIGNTSIEQYATQVFDAWKLGTKPKDNGVLIVIVPQDRKMRIEVGYGLEGTLTDVAASRIIRNLMTPQFKAGNYDQGVQDGVRAVLAQLEGATNVAPDPTARDANGISWPVRILLGVFVFAMLGLFTGIGIVTPGFTGWFLYPFLIPFWAMFPLMIIGGEPTLIVFVIYLLGFPIAKQVLSHSAWYAKAAQDLKSKGRASIGGFTILGGGFGGGSSAGGGGFSGGGGSSGGGGASGSW